MIFKYDEFKEANKHHASMLSYFESDDKMLHEMSVDEVKKFLYKNGRTTFYQKKTALLYYLRWLYEEHDVNTVELNYDVSNIYVDNESFDDVYFYSLEDMHNGVATCIKQAEVTYESRGEKVDFDGFYVYCLLQWYGIANKDFISIRIQDVNANEIYIPSLDQTIVVDDKTADIINDYKNKTGCTTTSGVFGLYRQNTLFRTLRPQNINLKTIANIRHKFYSVCDDKRFTLKHIMDSGKYFKLIQLEEQLGYEITSSQADQQKVFKVLGYNMNITRYVMTMSEFKVYKHLRTKWLNNNK